jgi:ethanolamine utilization protein EutQ
MRRVITADTVEQEHARGRTRIAAPRGRAVITPGAWTRAQALGVTFDQSEDAAETESSGAREVDASRVVRVRGDSVRLGPFAGAPNVGLTDVVTGRDGSPMTAGFMAWRRDDSFSWSLDYDEIDYVLEGVLHLGIDGRTIEGKAGDVLYIPKGSRVLFGTPSRVRVFYVTYPADWSGPPAGR